MLGSAALTGPTIKPMITAANTYNFTIELSFDGTKPQRLLIRIRDHGSSRPNQEHCKTCACNICSQRLRIWQHPIRQQADQTVSYISKLLVLRCGRRSAHCYISGRFNARTDRVKQVSKWIFQARAFDAF